MRESMLSARHSMRSRWAFFAVKLNQRPRSAETRLLIGRVGLDFDARWRRTVFVAERDGFGQRADDERARIGEAEAPDEPRFIDAGRHVRPMATLNLPAPGGVAAISLLEKWSRVGSSRSEPAALTSTWSRPCRRAGTDLRAGRREVAQSRRTRRR